MSLPADFLNGFASAAFQVEGAAKEGGRGLSIWDTFCATPGRIADGSNGDVACDSYHKWRQDIALLKQYGARTYRFSISWTRIIPLGGINDPINPEGIAFYNAFINALLAEGITPFLTLYHWDLPQALQYRYLGFLSRDIIPDFVNYARVCFAAFGDRVNHWITFNEPDVICGHGHSIGVMAPGRSSDRTRCPEGDSSTEPWIVAHHILLAHAYAVKLYREEFQPPQGQIGITLNGDWCEPYSPADKDAAQRRLEFWIGHYADPVYLTGDYPACMRAQLGSRLPTFTPEESQLLKGSSDFYGMNTYTSGYIKDRNTPPDPLDYVGNVESTKVGPDGKQMGPQAESFWLQDVPWGFRKLLNWAWKRYGLPIHVTENGTSVPNENALSLEDALNDIFRVRYYEGYLNAMLDAVTLDGVKVLGYMAWSLLDNFEWAEGYNTRFGVTYIDYIDEQRRYPKASAKFIKKWFDEHIVCSSAGGGIGTGRLESSNEMRVEELEDTTSEISTDGQSPVPVTSNGSVTPEDELDEIFHSMSKSPHIVASTISAGSNHVS